MYILLTFDLNSGFISIFLFSCFLFFSCFILQFKDPWKLLDPHDPCAGKDIPLKKGVSIFCSNRDKNEYYIT